MSRALSELQNEDLIYWIKILFTYPELQHKYYR